MDVTTIFWESLVSLTKTVLATLTGSGALYIHPDPPYFASMQDKLLGLETRSKPLAENQILQSTGSSRANPC